MTDPLLTRRPAGEIVDRVLGMEDSVEIRRLLNEVLE